MNKRILNMLIICTLITGMFHFNTFAKEGTYSEDSAITLVRTLGIMVGDGNGNMQLNKNVSRAEFAKIAVMMSSYRNLVPKTSTTSVFSDCNFKHWASGYVKVAVANGIITGYPNGTFKPDNTVTLEEACTVMLKLLGYTNDDFGNSWPYGQIGIAKNIHLLDNMTNNVGDSLKRYDVLKLVYNTLVANPKTANDSSAKYLEQLDCNLYEETVIIATNEQNNSVTPGYVLTSAGTFKINGEITDEYIGRKGDLIVKNKKDYAAFMPGEQISKKYVVYSILQDNIVAYSDGSITNFEVDDNITAYIDTNKSTFSQVKNSISTGDTIYLIRDSGGNIDYITVTTGSMKGPYTIKSSDLQNIKSNIGNISVMRNGVRADAVDVKLNDIAYYLPEINTVFVYSKKVTGVYEKATPNRDMPSAVTVSGKEYKIECATAFDKLSSNGNYKIGDTITLLLGKDGQIADVLDSDSTSETAGYLIDTGTKQFTDSDGDIFTSVYATVVCPDGSLLEVITKSDYDSYINRVMRITYKNGFATLTAEPSDNSSLYGKVDCNNMKIGNTKISDNVNILDVSTSRTDDDPGAYVTTYIQRLDGIEIESGQVLYVKKDSQGIVTDIILNNVTGDCYNYGVITDLVESGSGTGMSVTSKRYTCDILGDKYTCNVNYGSTFKRNMPAAFLVSGMEVTEMKKLNIIEGTVDEIEEQCIWVGSEKYLLSDKVSVYKVASTGNTMSAFTVIPLSELKNNMEEYTITAYTDKPQSKGGRVRVILAR